MIHGIVKGSTLVHYLELRTPRQPVNCAQHPECYRTLCDLHVDRGRTVDAEVNCLPCVIVGQERLSEQRKQLEAAELARKGLMKA